MRNNPAGLFSLLAALLSGCLAHEVKATRATLSDTVGAVLDDPLAGLASLTEKAGYQPTAPRGDLHLGDLQLPNGAKFMGGEDCYERVPVEHSAVALPSYTSADQGSWNLQARELSGKVGTVEAAGGARLIVSARLVGVGVEQVALGSLVPTAACLETLERAGSPLRIVSGLLVAEGMEVGIEAGRYTDVHGLLRPMVGKLEGNGNRVAETTYGYSVSGHVAIGLRTNSVDPHRGGR